MHRITRRSSSLSSLDNNTDCGGNEDASIGEAYRAASNAADQLEAFLHPSAESNPVLGLLDEDDLSIARELRRLQSLEAALERELQGVHCHLDTVSSSSLDDDDDHIVDCTSPVQIEGKTAAIDLPDLMLVSPVPSCKSSRETSSRGGSPERYSSGEEDDDDDNDHARYLLNRWQGRRRCDVISREGWEKFQDEVETLLKSMHGAPPCCPKVLFESPLEEEEMIKNGGRDDEPRPCRNGRSGVLYAAATLLFGRHEYQTVHYFWPHKKATRTIQGTLSVVLAAALAMHCWLDNDETLLSGQLILLYYMMLTACLGWVTANLPSCVDDTILTFLCWVAISVKLMHVQLY